MARKRANLNDLLNDLTFKVIYDKYKLIALNAFEWEGLPEGIEERHIERELFERGYTSFFRDPAMSFMTLPCSSSGQLNVYGDPLKYTAYGFNYRRELKADECVIFENNKLRLPTKDFLLFYVNKLTEIERTMDVNVKANKTPVIVTCSDRDVLSFKRIFQQVDGNSPAVFADNSLNPESMQALDLKAKFLGNELMNYKKSVENELLTFFGENNLPVEKKERMITDEANSNNQLIESFFDLGLEARLRGCEKARKLYGKEISVKRRQNFPTTVGKGVENSDEKDGDEE